MTRVRSQPRISPNDIAVDAVEVIGELLPVPMLLPFSISEESGSGSPCFNPRSNSSVGDEPDLYPDEYTDLCNQTQEANNTDSDEPKFVILLSKFEILFSVLDCAYGLPQPVGYYEVDGYEPMTAEVYIEQVKYNPFSWRLLIKIATAKIQKLISLYIPQTRFSAVTDDQILPQITVLLFVVIILHAMCCNHLQEEEASRSVSGYFNITIGETTLQFPADITDKQLEDLMSVQFPEEGGMYVCSY